MRTIFRLFISIIIIITTNTCSKDESSQEQPPQQYQLNVQVLPSNGGTVSPSSGTFQEGEQITITATPSSERYDFNNWSGDSSGTSNTINATMNGNKNITANFQEIAPVYTDGNGMIGSLGGTVRIDDQSSPLNGAYVIIPEGALVNDEFIEILLANDVQFYLDESLPIARFEPEGLQFLKDVEIGLPYSENISDTSNLEIINYEEENERIDEMIKISINETTHIISASSTHFSSYIAWDMDVGANISMLNIDGKIGANITVYGINNGGNGFSGIPSSFFDSYDSAWECLVDTYHQDSFSLFRVNLWQDNLLIDSYIEGQNLGIYRAPFAGETSYAQIFFQNPNVQIFDSGQLLNQDFGASDALGTWFSGAPVIFVFEHDDIDPNKNYYITVEWALSKDENATAFHTPIFNFNNEGGKKKISEMNNYTNNSINSNIDDDYQLWLDSDGDGVVDSEDQCPDFDDNLIGTECDDGDPTTIDDVYTENCVCEGTPDSDSDGDGVVDSLDQCPGFDDNLIGTECDDGDATTINDIYTENCVCEGTPDSDSDGDGVVDSLDQCPGFDDNLIGTECDDGDPTTINDIYTENCECSGTIESDIIFNDELSYGTLSDIDGNNYNTIIIGTQNWMAENLRVTKYNNSDNILFEQDANSWSNLNIGAYSNYDNDSSLINIYGRLYNHYAATDNRNICPVGWHVPTDDEFITLINYLGGTSIAGGKMKEIDLGHWLSPNEGATNLSGFTGLPGGYRGYDGNYFRIGEQGHFWTSSEYNNGQAKRRSLSYFQETVSSPYATNKETGYCIRCIQD